MVDVFSQGKYTGNPLAVFTNAGHLADTEMQQIAREINFSETTFILSHEPRRGGYDVRIFTPKEEVPFAGHPTLGTAYILRNEVMETAADNLRLNLRNGQIPVTFDGAQSLYWMQQDQPFFGATFDVARMAEVLNLSVNDFDGRFPIQEVSTGLPVIVTPLKNLRAVKAARIDRERYFTLIEQTAAKAILVFSPETYEAENDLNVRDFADYFGVPEDPATGSSNGCLAGYLVHHRYFGTQSIQVRIEQGYEIPRPSLLHARAEQTESGIRVKVGGRVVPVARGVWEA
ncbi:phenazine biosynthesis protein [Alicyclobacillus contaminans]|uniref:PhzF family phenazine biosynthesis protein n=1 Tax=Alicyclobacillus contaminans TaxID=392016 RepID=UPI000422E8FF|nr:phenazine biosynthesis protein [Alicyclobacillus contaminans]